MLIKSTTEHAQNKRHKTATLRLNETLLCLEASRPGGLQMQTVFKSKVKVETGSLILAEESTSFSLAPGLDLCAIVLLSLYIVYLKSVLLLST